MHRDQCVRMKRGFTLVELMVVVAIIALLIAILLPSLSNARAASRMVVCQSNQRQFAMANEMYADANSNTYVPIKTRHGTNGGGYFGWFHNELYMKRMLSMEPKWLYDKLLCPDIPTPRPNPNPMVGGIRYGGTGNNYAWNRQGVRTPNGWNSHIEVDRHSIVRPSDKLHMMDNTDWHSVKHYADYVSYWDVYGESRLWSVAYRHLNESACVVYADMHTGFLTKYEMWPSDATQRDRIWELYK